MEFIGNTGIEYETGGTYIILKMKTLCCQLNERVEVGSTEEKQLLDLQTNKAIRENWEWNNAVAAADEARSPKWMESNTQNKTKLIHWDSMKWGAEQALCVHRTYAHTSSSSSTYEWIRLLYVADQWKPSFRHRRIHTWRAILCHSHSFWPNE